MPEIVTRIWSRVVWSTRTFSLHLFPQRPYILISLPQMTHFLDKDLVVLRFGLFHKEVWISGFFRKIQNIWQHWICIPTQQQLVRSTQQLPCLEERVFPTSPHSPLIPTVSGPPHTSSTSLPQGASELVADYQSGDFFGFPSLLS